MSHHSLSTATPELISVKFTNNLKRISRQIKSHFSKPMLKTEKPVYGGAVKSAENDARACLQQAFENEHSGQALIPSKGYIAASFLSLPLWTILAYFIARF